MKTNNKKKVVVSVLALAMGAGLAGSISGSVAWYQYSTRTTAQLQGVSAGTTRNLQVRIGSTGTWKQDLTVDDINSHLNIGGTDQPSKLALNPVTNQTTGNAKNAALTGFKEHPVYQYPELPDLSSQTSGTGEDLKYNYVQIPLQFRLLDNKGQGEKNVAKDVYLVDARFNDKRTDTTNYADITPALRVHFHSSSTDALLANTAESTNVSGALDLNKNDLIDRDGFTGDDLTTDKIVNYGGADQTKTAIGDITPTAQASYKVAEGSGQLLADDTDAYSFTGGVSLGQTKAEVTEGDQDYLEVTLTIWLEGWQTVTPAGSTASQAIWDTKFIGSDFGLQLRFACVADH